MAAVQGAGSTPNPKIGSDNATDDCAHLPPQYLKIAPRPQLYCELCFPHLQLGEHVLLAVLTPAPLSQHLEHSGRKEIHFGSPQRLCFDVRREQVILQNCTEEGPAIHQQHWDFQEVSNPLRKSLAVPVVSITSQALPRGQVLPFRPVPPLRKLNAWLEGPGEVKPTLQKCWVCT